MVLRRGHSAVSAAEAAEAQCERRGSVAKQRAGQRGPDIFSGQEALMEVSKADGAWNWALVAPDPSELPLSGGGRGSIEEMRDAISKHPHSFGLLRMEFGIPPDSKTKYVFIHASDPMDSGKFTAVQRGKAKAVESKIDRYIQGLVTYSARVNVESPDECTPDFVVGKLLEVVKGMGSEHISVEDFRKYQEWASQQNVEEDVRHKRVREEAQKAEQGVAPKAVAVAKVEPGEQEMPTQDEEARAESTRQRKRIKLYSVGDQVDVWSSKNDVWYMDAEVVDVAKETAQIDGIRIKAGSMKVVYDNGARFKWVPPQQMEAYLRPSPRPKSPAPLTDELLRAEHGFMGTSWEKCYVELNRGFLQWWPAREDARRGALPIGKMYLRGLQQKENDGEIQMRTDATQGVVYSFKAESMEAAQKWVDSMWLHAGYCEEMSEFAKAQEDGDHMRRQLMQVVLKKAPPVAGGGA